MDFPSFSLITGEREAIKFKQHFHDNMEKVYIERDSSLDSIMKLGGENQEKEISGIPYEIASLKYSFLSCQLRRENEAREN